MAQRGAQRAVAIYADAMRKNISQWVTYRSPLNRTAATASPYVSLFREAGVEFPEPVVDPAVIELTHGSWAGVSLKGLQESGRSEEADVAAAYRASSFLAKPIDGSGESKLDVLARAAEWLKQLERRHGRQQRNVIVFGHGTFQNCVELLLRRYPEKSVSELFDRNPTGSSHLRRGEVHVLSPIFPPSVHSHL